MALTVSLDDIVASGNSLLAIKPHWQRVRLGDVGHVLNGYAFKAELFTREGGMPLIRIRDIDNAASETFYSGDFDDRYVVNAGDLLVGMDGDFNCARWRGPRSLLNQRVCKITVDEALYLPRFLDYVLPGYLKAINDATSSVTVKHLSSRTIQDIPLPLPPMDEQREIVAELEKQFSRLDEAVADLQRVKANLKHYKASVLKAAVEGSLVETEATLARREGRTYETGEQLLQRILKERKEKWAGKGKYKEPVAQTAELNTAVPDGWTSATVDQLGSVQLGKMLDKQKHTAGAPYRYLRNINVRWGTFDVSDVFEMNFETDELERFSVRAGDVLVCEGGEPARAAVWRSKQTDMKYQKALHRVRFDGAYLPDLLVIALEHLAKSGALDELYGGSTIKHFTRETFVKLVLPVPPAAEQARIVAEVDRHLSIIREVEAEVDANLQRAHALRQSVLAKAFSGELSLGSSQSLGNTASEARPSKHLESPTVAIAARIIAAHYQEPTFGRVRLQKQLHLATYIAQVAANDEYERKQAGPLDMTMLSGVIKRVNDLGWFRETERAGKEPGSKAYGYSALTKADEYKQHLNALTPAQQKTVDGLIQRMRNWTTEECELLSTVYAAWNDLILWNRPPTERAVIDQVHNHWHESKRKFSAEKIVEMMHKIKGWGYTPVGFGRPTFGQAADTASGDLFPIAN